VAGFVRGTGFSQGGGPFWRSIFLTGRRSVPRGARPGRWCAPGLEGCLFLVRGGLFLLVRGGRWLLGRVFLRVCNRRQQALPYRLGQHRLLYPHRRPGRISRTGHAARQRCDVVVFCRVDHPLGAYEDPRFCYPDIPVLSIQPE
jgi:hypothetical protein